jgi:hypothetical protein
MGKYDPREIFNREPAVIAGAIRSVLYTAILLGVPYVKDLTIEQLAGIAIGLEVVLGLFVRSSSTPNVTVAEIVKTPPTAAGPIAAAEAAGVDTSKPAEG